MSTFNEYTAGNWTEPVEVSIKPTASEYGVDIATAKPPIKDTLEENQQRTIILCILYKSIINLQKRTTSLRKTKGCVPIFHTCSNVEIPVNYAALTVETLLSLLHDDQNLLMFGCRWFRDRSYFGHHFWGNHCSDYCITVCGVHLRLFQNAEKEEKDDENESSELK